MRITISLLVMAIIISVHSQAATIRSSHHFPKKIEMTELESGKALALRFSEFNRDGYEIQEWTGGCNKTETSHPTYVKHLGTQPDYYMPVMQINGMPWTVTGSTAWGYGTQDVTWPNEIVYESAQDCEQALANPQLNILPKSISFWFVADRGPLFPDLSDYALKWYPQTGEAVLIKRYFGYPDQDIAKGKITRWQ